MELKIVNFIKQNPDWKEKLSNPPYSLRIKQKGNLISFKYSQIDSDFSLEIVNEARGLILETGTWRPVALAFKKFFNYGEPFAAKIDWNTAKVTSKEDGSLIKVYFYNSWRVATNSTIDAEDAMLGTDGYKNFRQLFDVAAKNSGLDFDRLDPRYCYIFELCSKTNRVVVPYGDAELFHIGTRNMTTLDEEEINIGIQKPRVYKLSSLEDCIAMAKTFDYTQEGFVVRDQFYNRIKVKSLDYISKHRMVNNHNMTLERAIELIRENEVDEFLTYFNNYKDYIDSVKNGFNTLKTKIESDIMLAKTTKVAIGSDRKTFSEWAKTMILPPVCFKVYDNPDYTAKDYINSLTNKKIADLIKKLNIECLSF